MRNKRLLGLGVTGAALASLFCLTPVLVLALSAVGLFAWIGWLDFVLIPAFLLFAGIAVYGFLQWRRGKPRKV